MVPLTTSVSGNVKVKTSANIIGTTLDHPFPWKKHDLEMMVIPTKESKSTKFSTLECRNGSLGHLSKTLVRSLERLLFGWVQHDDVLILSYQYTIWLLVQYNNVPIIFYLYTIWLLVQSQQLPPFLCINQNSKGCLRY